MTIPIIILKYTFQQRNKWSWLTLVRRLQPIRLRQAAAVTGVRARRGGGAAGPWRGAQGSQAHHLREHGQALRHRRRQGAPRRAAGRRRRLAPRNLGPPPPRAGSAAVLGPERPGQRPWRMHGSGPLALALGAQQRALALALGPRSRRGLGQRHAGSARERRRQAEDDGK